MQIDSTKRFTDRVDDYVKYRPSYPPEVIETLKKECGLNPGHIVVDIGSGTGISSELFLKNENTVYAVEPNEAMRRSAEALLGKYKNFHSVGGTAEATNLPAEMADFVVAAQAFHWFKPEPTKKEFQRILKKNGYTVVLFNDRKTSGSQFAEQYEQLLNSFGGDYAQVKHKNVTEKRHREFLGNYKDFYFPNNQVFDFQGLLGQVKSSSYAPKEGHPGYENMMKSLKNIFEENQKNGLVTMEYTTQIFFSQIRN